MGPLVAKYPAHLVVDAGGWVERTNPDRPELRSRLLLEGLRELGLQIANVSARDLRIGPEALRACEDSLGIQLVSANIEVGGKPWFKPYVLSSRKVWGREVRIAVTAVTAGQRGADRGWPDSLTPQVTDPVACAGRMLELLAPQSDIQVLLAFLPASDLEQLAKDQPEWDLLVGSTGDQRDPPPVGPVPAILATGTKCKYLGWVALRPADSGGLVVAQSDLVALDAEVRDDPRMAERVRVFKTRLGNGAPPAVTAPGASPDGSAGSTAAHP